ncbi:MAG: hypothetical protein JNL54_21970 [Kineosporiaceae bacterium]|nr:hypothetical protein [Kineosporiaceae bacterium]
MPAAAAVVAGPVAPVQAAPGDPPPIIVTPGAFGGTVGIEVRSPGRPGWDGQAGDGADVVPAGNAPAPDPCASNPLGSACAGFDIGVYCYAWGTRFLEAGLPVTGLGPLMQGVGCPADMPVPAALTPAMLAQRAYALLRLPKPTIERSPAAGNSDGGRPYTWVNLWTWFWTDPVTFTPRSKTVAAGAISATATATPVALVFDPGTGDAPVTCPGPGRPWREADGDTAPSAGGCGYRYLHVNETVTATVTIRWRVTWTGSNGESGVLPPLLTSATSSFAVQQIQAVTR